MSPRDGRSSSARAMATSPPDRSRRGAARHATGPAPDDAALPREAAAESFLRHLEVERRVSPHTLEAYRRDLSRLCAFARARGLTLRRLSRVDLEDFVREAMIAGLAPASSARLVAAVRSFFRFEQLT